MFVYFDFKSYVHYSFQKCWNQEGWIFNKINQQIFLSYLIKNDVFSYELLFSQEKNPSI